MRISKSTKTDVKASTDKCSFGYWLENVMDERLAGLDLDAQHEEYIQWKNNNCKDVEACGDVKCPTSADLLALNHIRAAIDILGKSGNKDDVTKDSIANLATVMFDIKGGNQ